MKITDEVERVIESARRHGQDSDPDHEVGDLQECLRAACAQMFTDQFERFMTSQAVRDTLELGGDMRLPSVSPE